MAGLKIGALAARTRTNPPTIRYYETVGLLPAASRQAGGQRRYGDDDVRRLTFIRRCRDFGFSVDQVRQLTRLMADRDRSCVEIRDLTLDHLREVRARLAELRALEASLKALLADASGRCAGGPAADCTIVEGLGGPDAAVRIS